MVQSLRKEQEQEQKQQEKLDELEGFALGER